MSDALMLQMSEDLRKIRMAIESLSDKPAEGPAKPCNHVIGFDEGVDESWLVYMDDDAWKKRINKEGVSQIEIPFNYCPNCGRKL